MNPDELAARIDMAGCSIDLDRYPKNSFGGTTIDFQIRSFDDWPSFFDTDLDRPKQPKFIMSSSITLKTTGGYSISFLDHDPDEFKEEVGMSLDEAVGDVIVDEVVLHLPPYRESDREALNEHFTLPDGWTIVTGQRIGFGPVDPDWGIVPHLYYSGDGASPSEALRMVRQCVRFIDGNQPITGAEIADSIKSLQTK